MNDLVTKEQYKAVRLALKYTQSELAEVLGVARETISRRENGKEPIYAEASQAIRFQYVAQCGKYTLPEAPFFSDADYMSELERLGEESHKRQYA